MRSAAPPGVPCLSLIHISSEAPAPATGNAPSGSLLDNLQNPAALQRVWQAALTTLKKSKAAYGVLFLNTKAAFDAARATLVLSLIHI